MSDTRYFNADQEKYMNELAKIPPPERCWCGWYRLGACGHCPPGATYADNLAMYDVPGRTSPPQSEEAAP